MADSNKILPDVLKMAANAVKIDRQKWADEQRAYKELNESEEQFKQRVAEKYGVKVIKGSDSFDIYSDISSIEILNNPAGKAMKGMTVEEKKITFHYDKAPDKSLPLDLIRMNDLPDNNPNKNKLVFSETEILLTSEVPKNKFDIKINTPNTEITYGEPKHTSLSLGGDNFSDVSVDVKNAGPGTKIVNDTTGQMNVTGTNVEQREALMKQPEKDQLALLTLSNEGSGNIVVGNGDHHKISITLDEIPHGEVSAPAGLPAAPSVKGQKR